MCYKADNFALEGWLEFKWRNFGGRGICVFFANFADAI